MDEALWLPTEKAVRVALRTQQVIAYESGAADTIDPLAGSYVIEYLTDEIEKQAGEYISKIDEFGGAMAAIEQGYIQGEIQEAAYRYQKAVEEREQIVVGLNAFHIDEKIELDRLRVDPEIEAGQTARLKDLRARRDNTRVQELMGRIESAARDNENMMPLFIESVENGLTLGEICGVLRRTWGEYQSPSWI
jgi:methylmalonyl-CoA mutase, N-terminal domain